jgi:hypothetical protein
MLVRVVGLVLGRDDCVCTVVRRARSGVYFAGVGFDHKTGLQCLACGAVRRGWRSKPGSSIDLIPVQSCVITASCMLRGLC